MYGQLGWRIAAYFIARRATMDETSILKSFRKKTILTVKELAGLLGRSAITARRRLAQWNTYTSINCNGRYYVLPDIPVFDRNGLWSFKLKFPPA